MATETWAGVFYRHLDSCERCMEQPFNLCAIGALLLNQAAREQTVKFMELFEGGEDQA